MSSINVHGLAAGYGRTRVVSGVQATVPSGGCLGIIGPNGSGKSTLLKALAGVITHEGTVSFNGYRADELNRKQRARQVAYAPQIPQIPVGLSVTDYVLLGRTPHLSPLATESRKDLDVVTDVLQRLDLVALAHRSLATLSGGERQRAVLARALAQRAGVLLLDEPTTGLDIGHAQAMLDLIDELRRESGTTVVMTLHDLTLAAQYAKHLLMLDSGEVVAQGSPGEVLTTETLAERYTARVTVLYAPDGAPVITPVRE